MGSVTKTCIICGKEFSSSRSDNRVRTCGAPRCRSTLMAQRATESGWRQSMTAFRYKHWK